MVTCAIEQITKQLINTEHPIFNAGGANLPYLKVDTQVDTRVQ